MRMVGGGCLEVDGWRCLVVDGWRSLEVDRKMDVKTDGDVWAALAHPNGVADDPCALCFTDDLSVVQRVPKLLPIRHHNEDPVSSCPGSLPQVEQFPPAPGRWNGRLFWDYGVAPRREEGAGWIRGWDLHHGLDSTGCEGESSLLCDEADLLLPLRRGQPGKGGKVKMDVDFTGELHEGKLVEGGGGGGGCDGAGSGHPWVLGTQSWEG